MSDEVWDADGECQPPDYGSVAYWEAHFAAAPHGSVDDPAALEFEWLCQDLDSLVALLRPHLPKAGLLLHPGCGMSLLPLRLQEENPELEILSVDSSPSCVASMRASHPECERRGLTWEVLDVRSCLRLGAPELGRRAYAGAVEKGCLDALLCSSEEEAASYVRGLAAVLGPGAVLLLVSNTSARSRHLSTHFDVKEVVPIIPEDAPFGPCLYVCEVLTKVDLEEA